MSEIEKVIGEARAALSENDTQKALKLLKPFKKGLQNENKINLPLQQLFADVYLEDGQVDKAYPILVHCCELDPYGKLGGSDKFFTLGQVMGGESGLTVIKKGIDNICSQADSENLPKEQVSKIVNGLLSMIEIWMTDLCMEPNAEEECETLITQAMQISHETSPEVWSTLGSIRISQQRFDDACEAFRQAWKFFEVRKNEIGQNGMPTSESSASLEEYVDLLQPLASLAKMCIEVGLYDIALKVEAAIKEIDEDNMEAYYLEGFTYYLISKAALFKEKNPDLELTPGKIYEFNQHIQEIPMELNNPLVADSVQDARASLSFASQLGQNADPSDEISQEILTGTLALLEELGGAISDADLQKLRKGEVVEDDVAGAAESDYDFESGGEE